MHYLPTFFSIYRARAQVIKTLERIRKDFLWGSTPEYDKINWVRWKNVTIMKECGGVGIGSLKEANLAMLAKWWWRFKTDRDSLWRRVIWCLHNSSRSWNFIPCRLTLSGPWKQVNSVAKDMEEYVFDLHRAFRGVAGYGHCISFWKDCWIFEEPLCIKFPNMYNLEVNKNVQVAERLVKDNGAIIIKFNWQRSPSTEEELYQLETLSHELTLVNLRDVEDSWTWSHDASGIFSVSSLRRQLQRVESLNEAAGFVWNNWAPVKVNFFGLEDYYGAGSVHGCTAAETRNA
ncbi:hypothetical protein Hdeb2414_s0006g00210941 [Helianthus debilis subsp. tardiflorus]